MYYVYIMVRSQIVNNIMSDVPTILKKTFRFHVKYNMVITKCTFSKNNNYFIKAIILKIVNKQ